MKDVFKKLDEVRANLSPLRFLLLNFKLQGQNEYDSYDLQCLGEVIDKNLRLLDEVSRKLDNSEFKDNYLKNPKRNSSHGSWKKI